MGPHPFFFVVGLGQLLEVVSVTFNALCHRPFLVTFNYITCICFALRIYQRASTTLYYEYESFESDLLLCYEKSDPFELLLKTTEMVTCSGCGIITAETIYLLSNILRACVPVGHSNIDCCDHRVRRDALCRIAEFVVRKALVCLDEGDGDWDAAIPVDAGRCGGANSRSSFAYSVGQRVRGRIH